MSIPRWATPFRPVGRENAFNRQHAKEQEDKSANMSNAAVIHDR
jgi:hypothetical protein